MKPSIHGATYVSTTKLEASAKKLTVNVENSGYRRIAN